MSDNLNLRIDAAEMNQRLKILGDIGRDKDGKLIRLAASPEDKLARDQLVSWMKEDGLEVEVDRIGNIFGIWNTSENKSKDVVMIGSHIDTVIDAGIYDGTYGVLAALSVVKFLKKQVDRPKHPVVIVAFTNEEGVRYTPDMMGSLVYANGYPLENALNSQGIDKSILGEELRRLGYAGKNEPGFIKPRAFIEMHIEQGPTLEHEQIEIGAVERLQGISWQKVTVSGQADHAGTTPISMRHDAGLAASKINTFLREYALNVPNMVTTIGCISYEPNAINIIPAKAEFTVDMRNPDEDLLRDVETALERFARNIEIEEGVSINFERLARFEPVQFDSSLIENISSSATELGLSSKKMTSGAGHDAQMMARICPSAMIFVPSKNGISHSPYEYTAPEHLEAGANVMLQVVKKMI